MMSGRKTKTKTKTKAKTKAKRSCCSEQLLSPSKKMRRSGRMKRKC